MASQEDIEAGRPWYASDGPGRNRTAAIEMLLRKADDKAVAGGWWMDGGTFTVQK